VFLFKVFCEFFSASVTDVWVLSIIWKGCRRRRFLIVGKRENFSHGDKPQVYEGCRITAMFLDVQNSPHRKHIVTGRNVAKLKSRTGRPSLPSRPLLPIQYFAAGFHISNELFEISNHLLSHIREG